VGAWLRHPRDVPAAGTADRVRYLDNLKAILVAGVIFGHAWAGYAELGSWAYDDVREVTLAARTETVLEVLFGPFALFVMGFFFLMAGLLTRGSLDRKGPGRFARDRLLRLGLPLAVFSVLLWPPSKYVMFRLAGRPTGPLGPALRHAVLDPDPVHLWFLEVLLLFSLGYAGWRQLRPPPSGPVRSGVAELGGAHLVALALGIAGASFLVRIWFPLDTSQYADLHLSQWPQYLALFGLGLAAARYGWLDPVPDRLRRGCAVAALLGAVAIAGFAGVVALAGVPTQDFLGGWHWASAGTAAAEGLLAVALSVWLLGVAQRRLDRGSGRTWATRGAYAAFLVQAYVLVGLALLLRPFALPAEVKAAVVSTVGVLASFALGRVLVARTPLRRILCRARRADLAFRRSGWRIVRTRISSGRLTVPLGTGCADNPLNGPTRSCGQEERQMTRDGTAGPVAHGPTPAGTARHERAAR
jgi:hypothetical protein